MTDDEWRRRFLARLNAAGYPHTRLQGLVARTEVTEMRETLGEDPEKAADKELVHWSGPGSIQ